jgi:hypothetical protein
VPDGIAFLNTDMEHRIDKKQTSEDKVRVVEALLKADEAEEK